MAKQDRDFQRLQAEQARERQVWTTINRRMLGKRVFCLNATGGFFADVDDVKDWETFIVRNGDKKSEVNIFDIRSVD